MKNINILIAVLLGVSLMFMGCTNNEESPITGAMVDDVPTDNSTSVEPVTEAKVTVHFFWGDGCPHCHKQIPYLDELEDKYPEIEIKRYETWKNSDNRELFQQAAAAYGIEARGVPATFIGEKNWVGFTTRMVSEMEAVIEDCIANGCTSPY